MVEVKQTRKQLLKRRNEIIDQLEKVNRNLHMELDHDIEEQAIEIEQEEVAISMEHNLRAEMNAIDDRLRDLDDQQQSEKIRL